MRKSSLYNSQENQTDESDITNLLIRQDKPKFSSNSLSKLNILV